MVRDVKSQGGSDSETLRKRHWENKTVRVRYSMWLSTEEDKSGMTALIGDLYVLPLAT